VELVFCAELGENSAQASAIPSARESRAGRRRAIMRGS
jgi:hypothetical protein